MFRFAQTHPKLTAFVGFVLPGILATVIEYALTGGTTGVIPIVAALVAGAPTVAVLYFIGAFADQSEPQTSNQIDDGRGRYFTPRPAKELVDEQRGNTSFIANEVSERHKGHWMELTGSVKDVDEWPNNMMMFLETTDSATYVHIDFEKQKWKDKLRSVRKGDIVDVVGEIYRTGDNGLDLRHGELQSVRSVVAPTAESIVA